MGPGTSKASSPLLSADGALHASWLGDTLAGTWGEGLAGHVCCTAPLRPSVFYPLTVMAEHFPRWPLMLRKCQLLSPAFAPETQVSSPHQLPHSGDCASHWEITQGPPSLLPHLGPPQLPFLCPAPHMQPGPSSNPSSTNDHT